jgi:hypothetical protein
VAFKNYRNENNEFQYQETLADSLITIYETMWASSPYLRDYANMTPERRAPLNPIYPKDPRLSIQPTDAFSTRLISLIDQESTGIDVNVLRFESEPLANGLIRRHRARVPVRVNTESAEYRLASRPMVSFILDTLWAAGVPLKWRAHSGNNHEKVGIFHAQRVVVRGSSNWSPGSDQGNTNIELNLFSNPLTHLEDLDAYEHFVPKFERRWSNLQYVDGVPVTESRWFVPQSPGSSTYLLPANAATVSTTTPTLSFTVKWAHYVDVYYGGSPTALIKYRDRMRVASNSTINVVLPALTVGSYYWRVVVRTAADRISTGPTWSFLVP